MNSTSTIIKIFAMTILLMMISVTTAHADTITMKSSITLQASADEITLGDIADLQGDAALKFADVVLTTRKENTERLTITVEQVRETLQTAGAHWGLIDLNGCETYVRLATRLAQPPLAMTEVSIGSHAVINKTVTAKSNALLAGNILKQRTAASVVAATLAQKLNIDPKQLRLTFDSKNRTILDLPTAQYRIEIQPLGNIDSDRVTMQIRAWKDGLITHRQSIGVSVEVLVDVAVVDRTIRRGTVLSAGDVQHVTKWINAGRLREVVSASEINDKIAKVTLKQGDMIRQRDIKRETLIERGDIIHVRCLVGGVALSMRAEARGDGSEGDTIEFRKLGERDTFLARVTGRAEAVVDLARR